MPHAGSNPALPTTFKLEFILSSTDKHPLMGAVGWVFTQPYMHVHSSVMIKDLKTEEEIKLNITSYAHCREGAISEIRTAMQRRCTNQIKKGDKAWEVALKPTCSISLDDARCLGVGDTVLSVHDTLDYKTKQYGIKDERLEEFLRVCDAIVGIPALLLNPNRKPGDWWRTDHNKAIKPQAGDSRYIGWNGADNAFLRHPALFASMAGLFRQAFWLCKAGFGSKVLKELDYGRVEKVLTDPSWKEALELAESLKTWISVPVPAGGATSNVSFPWYPRSAKQVSYWQRFIRLQRALHRHSTDEVFGGDIFEGWALLNKGTQFSGAFTYWGEAKKLTPAHKHLMELGKPKEKANEAEQAS